MTENAAHLLLVDDDVETETAAQPQPEPEAGMDELDIDELDMDELVTVEAISDDLFVDEMPAPAAGDLLPPPMAGAGVEPVDFPKPGLIDGPIDGLALT